MADNDFYRVRDRMAGGTDNQWVEAADFDQGREWEQPEVDIVPSSSGTLSQSELAS
jgi:hypothetical protein